MKKLLIMCGTGIATSTVVVGKIKEWLKENGLEDNVKIYQGKVAEEITRIDDYDIVISTTLVPDNCKDKVINGLCLLTGIGKEEMFQKLKLEIEE
ncbi:PTS sugar transporter subunit IIB [Oceanivirga salmonicida]|uniref:PTS sugar transporter subunit IIB n=1 Tax=Oceanivirga salmonicida TaxID=1769291 RepID=UPI0012E23881|nr:PTS sugar transporter subunit IIB [Oceanivirga salmonicida]